MVAYLAPFVTIIQMEVQCILTHQEATCSNNHHTPTPFLRPGQWHLHMLGEWTMVSSILSVAIHPALWYQPIQLHQASSSTPATPLTCSTSWQSGHTWTDNYLRDNRWTACRQLRDKMKDNTWIDYRPWKGRNRWNDRCQFLEQIQWNLIGSFSAINNHPLCPLAHSDHSLFTHVVIRIGLLM